MFKMEEKIRQAQIESIVHDAINFMPPYLEISSPSSHWISSRFPLIKLVEKCPGLGSEGGYHIEKNEIHIKLNNNHYKSTVVHEMGHWWHKMLNPDLFRIFSKLGKSLKNELAPSINTITNLSESVAFYCGNLYFGVQGLDKIDTFGLTLPKLVRIDFVSAKLLGEELKKLSVDLHKLSYISN